jgi:hypothetical protein
MREHADLYRRLDAMATRPGVQQDELEDLLTEGYARALAGEAQSLRLARRLAELVPEIDRPGVAKEARRLALQRRTVDQSVAELREKLASTRSSVAAVHGQHPASA